MRNRASRLTLLAVISSVAIAACGAVAAEQRLTTRPAVCAGTWYPGDRQTLADTVDKLLNEAKPAAIEGKPLAVIAPHAGYRFSAPVASAGYRCLRGQTYKRVFVIAFSHRYSYSYHGVDVPDDLSAYDTPLGPVPIDRETVAKLKSKHLFTSIPGLARDEHSLELQLPLLQRSIKGFKLVPLYVGQMSPEDFATAAEAIVPCLDQDTLLVASSDFTHFGPNYDYQPFKDDVAKRLTELADQAAAPLLACDFDGFSEHVSKTHDTICGRGPILLLLRVLSMKGGAQGVRTAFDTSGHLTGDYTNSVTYQSFVFTPRPPLFAEPLRRQLLQLARQTITAYLTGKQPPAVDKNKLPAPLREDGACFVTLQNHGELRGCIGNTEARDALYTAVVRNAVYACQDPRFTSNRVTASELGQIRIEISRLTPMKRIKDTGEVIIGRHGLLISLNGQRGLLLPQVAYERGWTRDEFLKQVCHKAGLSPDSWKRPEAELYSFEAEVFGESQSMNPPESQPHP
jgi:MEMO1 family protein